MVSDLDTLAPVVERLAEPRGPLNPFRDVPVAGDGLCLAHCASPGGGRPAVQIHVHGDQLIGAADSTATVIALLEGGADIDWQGDDGRTAVMAATVGNHADTVRALIDAEANVDIRDARLDNPFLYAGAEGLLDILRLTIAAGADPSLTNRFGGTALIPASERGHVEVVGAADEHRRRRRPRQQSRLDRAAGGDRLSNGDERRSGLASSCSSITGPTSPSATRTASRRWSTRDRAASRRSSGSSSPRPRAEDRAGPATPGGGR
jgi:hypothetical protein